MEQYVLLLKRLHEINIVHGDVEPKHMGLSSEDGSPQFIDMDCARRLSSQKNSPVTYFSSFRGAQLLFLTSTWTAGLMKNQHRFENTMVDTNFSACYGDARLSV